jgi:hypothetical protein
MEGINGKYLISVGTTSLFVYPIKSTGAVGKLASTIDTLSYGGAECGTTSDYNGAPNGAILDHTGKYFYVQLFDDNDCAAWQSYQVEPNGSLSFLGDVEYEEPVEAGGGVYVVDSSVPTISSDDKFGYGFFNGLGGSFSTFVKEPDGQLEVNDTFTEVDPAQNPDSPFYLSPTISQADPESHLVVLMESVDQDYDFGPYQLASYTINNSTGGVVSTNTWKNMPIPKACCLMNMSPSGKLLAMAGYPGLQIFHFNGAEPLTRFSSLLLPNVDVDQLAWDKSNHLYALSYSAEKLYVYTVTPTSVSEVSGSPYSVGSAYGINGLIVVPKL